MENLRGILFMILAMAGFACEDLFIKILSENLPISEIIMVLGFSGSVIFLKLAYLQKLLFFIGICYLFPSLLELYVNFLVLYFLFLLLP